MRSEPFRGRLTRRGCHQQMLPVGLNPQMGVVMKATLRYQHDCLYANRQSRSAQCKFENNDNRLRRGSLLALDQRSVEPAPARVITKSGAITFALGKWSFAVNKEQSG